MTRRIAGDRSRCLPRCGGSFGDGDDHGRAHLIGPPSAPIKGSAVNVVDRLRQPGRCAFDDADERCEVVNLT